jgi:hypothetical protein
VLLDLFGGHYIELHSLEYFTIVIYFKWTTKVEKDILPIFRHFTLDNRVFARVDDYKWQENTTQRRLIRIRG